MPTLQQVIAQRKRRAEAETGTIRGMIIDILPDILEELLDKAKPELVERLAPIVKSDVIERLKVKGEPGMPGRPGKDAQPVDENKIVQRVRALIPTPKNGKDADEDAITRKILAKMPTPKNGKDAVVEHEKITKQVVETLKEKRLKPEHIDGLGEMMESYWKKVRAQNRSGVLRGGGDIVAAGTGIAVTSVGGQKVISVTGSGSGITIETPAGVVNGSNATFTPTKRPLYVISDGVTYFESAGYTWTGTQIVMDVQPSIYIRDAISS